MFKIRYHLYDRVIDAGEVRTAEEIIPFMSGFEKFTPIVKQHSGRATAEYTPVIQMMKICEQFEDVIAGLEKEIGVMSPDQVKVAAREFIISKMKHCSVMAVRLWLDVLINNYSLAEVKMVIETTSHSAEQFENLMETRIAS